MTIQETALNLVFAMIDNNYTPHSAWCTYESTYMPIVRKHETCGFSVLSTEIVAEYVNEIETRYNRKNIAYGTFRRHVAGAERLLRFHLTGTLNQPYHSKYAQLNKYYDNVLADFSENSNNWGEASKRIAICHLRCHFYWLLNKGLPTLTSITAETIKEYLIYCSHKYQPRTVSLVKGKLKRIYVFLNQQGYVSNDFSSIFAFEVASSKKIRSVPSQTAIASILASIDRNTPKGKRDYAMIMLGVVTGLRASDIAVLKLTDIDWHKGEIRISQKKTGKPLALPLTQDVGEALHDYILNGRLSPLRKHKITYEQIFLTLNAPCAPFKSAASLAHVYTRYSERRNIESGTFHDLRRALGKNMVTAQVPIHTASQVLGHTDLDSTKQYISLDIQHLKECSLDFTGITLKGGDVS